MDTTTNRPTWVPHTLALVGVLLFATNGALDAFGVVLPRHWVSVAYYVVTASTAVAGFVLMMVGRARASSGIVEVGTGIADAIEALPSDAPASGDSTVRVTGGRE